MQGNRIREEKREAPEAIMRPALPLGSRPVGARRLGFGFLKCAEHVLSHEASDFVQLDIFVFGGLEEVRGQHQRAATGCRAWRQG